MKVCEVLLFLSLLAFIGCSGSGDEITVETTTKQELFSSTEDENKSSDTSDDDSTVSAICGNGLVELDEICDDGNTISEIACDYGTETCNTCNSTCDSVLNLSGSICGDGIVDPGSGEICDDGNTISEVACDYGTETCSTCNSTCDSVLNLSGNICGDGIVDPGGGEVCDDGNTVSETACEYGSATCSTCNATCDGVLNLTGNICGDGILDRDNEQCDSGSAENGQDYANCLTDDTKNCFCDSSCNVKNEFVSVWDISSSNTVRLPLPETFITYPSDNNCGSTSSTVNLNYNFTVDWGYEESGDRVTSTITSFDQAEVSHTYLNPGNFPDGVMVKITGTMEGFNIVNEAGPREMLTKVINLGNTGLKSLEGAFGNTTNLTSVRGGITSGVQSMRKMFLVARNVSTIDMSTWDTSNVTTMYDMFRAAVSAEVDLSYLDTSSVTDMGSAFHALTSSSKLDVSGFDVSKVTNMSYTFYQTYMGKGSWNGVDTSSIANYDAINASFADWDTSCVSNMKTMFRESVLNPETENWDTSRVTDMTQMFQNNEHADPNTSFWNTGAVENFKAMFAGNTIANPNVFGWDVSSADSFRMMFYEASQANPDTSQWVTSNATDFSFMFTRATSSNPDMGNWDFSNVKLGQDGIKGLDNIVLGSAISCDNKANLILSLVDSTSGAGPFLIPPVDAVIDPDLGLDSVPSDTSNPGQAMSEADDLRNDSWIVPYDVGTSAWSLCP